MGLSLHRLSRDYWPATTTRPYLRSAFAAVAAPTLLALALTSVVALVNSQTPPYDFDPLEHGPAVFFELAVTFYLAAALWGAPVFLALWSLRLRSRRAYAIGGLVVGLLGAAHQAASVGALRLAPVLILIALYGAMMLLVRWLAGVRKPSSRF